MHSPVLLSEIVLPSSPARCNILEPDLTPHGFTANDSTYPGYPFSNTGIPGSGQGSIPGIGGRRGIKTKPNGHGEYRRRGPPFKRAPGTPPNYPPFNRAPPTEPIDVPFDKIRTWENFSKPELPYYCDYIYSKLPREWWPARIGA